MKLNLTNNLTKIQTSLEVVDKKQSPDFFVCDAVLPEGMNDGEYEYELVGAEGTIATGLIQIGDYKAENKVYDNKEDNGYIVYDAD